jgi:hypothetical protein
MIRRSGGHCSALVARGGDPPLVERSSRRARPDTTVEPFTGYGKHRKAWSMSDVKQAVTQALAEMEVPTIPLSNNGRLAIDCAAWVQRSRE